MIPDFRRTHHQAGSASESLSSASTCPGALKQQKNHPSFRGDHTLSKRCDESPFVNFGIRSGPTKGGVNSSPSSVRIHTMYSRRWNGKTTHQRLIYTSARANHPHVEAASGCFPLPWTLLCWREVSTNPTMTGASRGCFQLELSKTQNSPCGCGC